MAGVWIQVEEVVEDGATDDDDDTETSTTTVPNTCSNSNSNQNSADETQSTDLDCDLDDDAPLTTTATTAGPVDLTTTTTVENSSNAADRNKSSGDVVKVNEITTFPYSTLFKSSGSKNVKMLYEAMCTFIPPDILDKVLYGLYGQVDQQNEDATTSTLESGELSSTSNNETHAGDGDIITNIRDIFDDETSSDEESAARTPSQQQQQQSRNK